jgi:FdhD protein
MGRESVTDRQIWRVEPGGRRETADRLVVEAPLELRVAGEPQVVLMRTPGHDRELVAGLLLAEGAIAGAAELAGVQVPEGLGSEEAGNVLELGPVRLPERALVASAGCGVCGKRAIAELELRARPIRSALAVEAGLIASLPARLRAHQTIFEETGGLHAAAAFAADGTLLALREDVGRHNAVDKVVGWALHAGHLPLGSAILCVSGRLGFEIAHKAIVAGFPMVVAVSAPSSLAVDLAERFRLTLCGFVRDRAFNVYSHPARVVGS